jgi:hypothetical protein
MAKHDKPTIQVIECAPTLWEVTLNSLPSKRTIQYLGRTVAVLAVCIIVYKIYKNRDAIFDAIIPECRTCRKELKFKKPKSPKAEKLASDSFLPESPRKLDIKNPSLPSIPEKTESNSSSSSS